jgi:DNA-binding CsgD family transcriptional regulator
MGKTFLFPIQKINKSLYNNDNKFLTDDEYTKLAKKIVKTFVRNYTVQNFILKNEDLISQIKYKIMMGDWRSNPEKGRTATSYRIQCGRWAIQNIYDAMRKTSDIVSLDADFSKSKNEHKSSNLAKTLVNNESGEFNIATKFEEIAKDANLTKKQREYLELVVNGDRIEDIAEKFKITPQSVYLHVSQAKKKIKALYGR